MSAPASPGFDQDFLGVATPMPTLPGIDTVLLPYTHFSTLHRPDRRLAAATAVAIDGATLRQLERSDDWRLDDRLPAEQQAGPELYADNDLDRGHLVRRQDPVWGEPAEAATAESDTFHYTNAAPQAAAFNQDKQTWGGLEDYLLDNAGDNDRRLVVFTGPVLADDDPEYRGVLVPRLFWKIGAFVTGGALGTTAYLLDQTPELGDLAEPPAGDPPPLGPYRTFQVPVARIGELTGLDLGPLTAADRMPVPEPVPAALSERAVRLRSFADIRGI
ncbi:DNA/RNA non-specific endonuclease [Pseudonocardia sp. Ae406_Ps2]|uniref:DNA/RNA non-specific endonuclease n=1 Tax=unclassified Pseudonocardia TaxID=2619320 RepID=UPI0002D4705D|nr:MULTISPECIES: DNA/RNA non-specific endonuclease [unclassified Pseudonocardia]OLM01757.1 DNA/RNA non-specific endonuclease [Pseudonocardia sp. Ae406_Ps2]OLM06461.1 DNA/RNA non-specific endonuclease [Pseudonocardia sp. Ae331_Ps2]OLM13199.1 DNA/RNA non-specific endonuclease [Pseudonocardia sp. Ae505_Ps2]OLM23327.1 DNA/RNA non-specific endonuclease [Pseudonocardia sp. Ae706_Ps2]OLM32383.1 DNA/RNA non-specific endonuclease [Pseudonocardia sp. Ae717_Ps2]